MTTAIKSSVMMTIGHLDLFISARAPKYMMIGYLDYTTRNQKRLHENWHIAKYAGNIFALLQIYTIPYVFHY